MKKKLRWSNLKIRLCPMCGKGLKEVGVINKCTEPCYFKINSEKLSMLAGFFPKKDSKVFYVDGWVMGHNPSKRGGGYTITDHNGELIEIKKIEKVGFTNNDGEVLGLIRGLEICEDGDEIYTDSKVAEIWVKSRKAKARLDLLPEIWRGNDIMMKKKVCISWIQREANLAGIYNENNIKY